MFTLYSRTGKPSMLLSAIIEIKSRERLLLFDEQKKMVEFKIASIQRQTENGSGYRPLNLVTSWPAIIADAYDSSWM